MVLAFHSNRPTTHAQILSTTERRPQSRWGGGTPVQRPPNLPPTPGRPGGHRTSCTQGRTHFPLKHEHFRKRSREHEALKLALGMPCQWGRDPRTTSANPGLICTCLGPTSRKGQAVRPIDHQAGGRPGMFHKVVGTRFLVICLWVPRFQGS